MAVFTNSFDLQAAFSACLTVRDWEMLTEAVQIPENFFPLSFARLTELTGVWKTRKSGTGSGNGTGTGTGTGTGKINE